MYDIVTLEPEDRKVMTAVSAIINGQGAIPGPPGGHHRFFVPGDVKQEGDGGQAVRTLVIVGHGNANRLSRKETWEAYREDLPGDWGGNPDRVYIASCRTVADGGRAFVFGNIASQIKAAYPNARVWASTTNVDAGAQFGNWEEIVRMAA
ncbi:MAG TPA: hypothetical protein VND65_03270 [Candidatus Binatia bacterium]|nr:hypothetical protein [Candidatus Binatia bacterium]